MDTGNLVADTWNNTGHTLYGNFQQLYLLKQQNRSLKVLLSVGGWNYSSHFALPANSTAGRSTFAASVVSLVKNLGLDGVDIDWEYPADAAQGQNMVYLLQAVRGSLDTYGNSLNPPYNFTLTVACPARFGYEYLRLADMDPYIDFWNLMAYDYTGPWTNLTGDQANLFSSADNPSSTPFNTEAIIGHYTSHNISPAKIVLGMPLYGRSFNSTAGMGQPLGQPFKGSGTYDYNELPFGGANVVYDPLTGSSYSYDAASGEIVSYDTTAVARQKAAWIMSSGLGGAMFWEGSADAPGNQSIIRNVAAVLAGSGGSLDSTLNELSYPDSTYGNVADGMPAPSSSSVLTPPSSLSTLAPVTPVPSTAATPPLSSGSSIAATPSTTAATPTCSGEVCGTYKYIACPDGLCMCGLDADRNSACVLNHSCEDVTTCLTNVDCCPPDTADCSMICLINNCCVDGNGHCAQLTDGCLDSPLTTTPSPTLDTCKRLVVPPICYR